MPSSKETHSAPVFEAPESCLPGIRLKFSLVAVKFLVKDDTWKELEKPRGPGLRMKLTVYKLQRTEYVLKLSSAYYEVIHVVVSFSAGSVLLVVSSMKD